MYRLFSLFSGVGAFEKALTNLKIEYEVVGYSEIDKFASEAYSIIHNIPQNKNLGDVSKIDSKNIPEYDILVGGSPCTNISSVGNRTGLKGNESKLFYDYARILNETKPKYFVFENVSNLIISNKGEDWKIVRAELSKNYNLTYDILNAIDYGIPQLRKRIFIVGIRKDIEQSFYFDMTKDLEIKFTDLLEDSVDPKFRLSTKERIYMSRKTHDGRDHYDFSHYHDTSMDHSRCLVANLYKGVPYNVLVDPRLCKFGHYDCDFADQDEEFCGPCVGDMFQENNDPTFAIRKMTPLECFRLFGFDDEDYKKIEATNISNTQAWKMIGNSIVVPVLEMIFKNLLLEGL